MIGTIIGTIWRKENYDVHAWKSSIKWGQMNNSQLEICCEKYD
jgi:hypothetical protein